MKLESTKSKHPQLVYEAKLYKILQGAVGACFIARRRANLCLTFLPSCPARMTAFRQLRANSHPVLCEVTSLQVFLTSAGTVWRCVHLTTGLREDAIRRRVRRSSLAGNSRQRHATQFVIFRSLRLVSRADLPTRIVQRSGYGFAWL